MKRTHLQAAPVVALLALLLSAAPVAAETVPDGVIADAAVTVTVTSGDAPVGGAPVTFETLGTGGVLSTASGVTADDGTFTLADAWRPDTGGPALDWRARVAWSQTKYGAEAGMPANCVLSESFDGESIVAASEGPASMAVVAAKGASSASCGPALHGYVIDGSGSAFAVHESYVSATDSTGHVWQLPFAVADDGAFTASVPPVVEEVSFFVRGVREETVDGCAYTYRLLVSESVAVDPENPVTLVAEEEAGAASCTATPKPNQGGGNLPGPTARPTQAAGGLPNATPPFTGGGVPGLTPPATNSSVSAPATAAPLELVLALIGLATLVTFLLVPRARGRAVRQTQ